MPWGQMLTSRDGAQGWCAHHLTMARCTLGVRSVSRPTSLAESRGQRQPHRREAAELGRSPEKSAAFPQSHRARSWAPSRSHCPLARGTCSRPHLPVRPPAPTDLLMATVNGTLVALRPPHPPSPCGSSHRGSSRGWSEAAAGQEGTGKNSRGSAPAGPCHLLSHAGSCLLLQPPPPKLRDGPPGSQLSSSSQNRNPGPVTLNTRRPPHPRPTAPSLPQGRWSHPCWGQEGRLVQAGSIPCMFSPGGTQREQKEAWEG